MPPALRHRLAEVLGTIPASGAVFEGAARARFERLVADGEPWLGAEPDLAELGYWMIEPQRAEELRRQGCRWLAHVPSVETARRLSALVLDAATPPGVREQAIRTLGARELRAMHPAALWPAEAVQLADEALVRVASDAATAGRIASEALPHALRHVASDGIAAVFARAPGLWGDALECFASPPLARVLAVSIEDIPPQHRLRVMRLVAATLGEEAVPVLLARASRRRAGRAAGDPVPRGRVRRRAPPRPAGGRGARRPAAGAAARAGEVAPPAPRRGPDGARPARRADHGDAPGGRARRALRPGGRRSRRAHAASSATRRRTCTRCGAWMVRGAGDPARARELVAAHPASQALVGELYLEDLARRGRVRSLVTAAQALEARRSRRAAARDLGPAARGAGAGGRGAAAHARAGVRAGPGVLPRRAARSDRPDPRRGSAAVGAHRRRAAAPFPGPDERWLIERAAAARPAIAALAGGAEAIAALAQPAPHDAEPDAPTIEPVLAVERRLGRGLAGRDRGPRRRAPGGAPRQLAAAVAAAGARLVAGPLPGTDYYVLGDWCLAQTIAQLERQGARRLRELEEAAR